MSDPIDTSNPVDAPTSTKRKIEFAHGRSWKLPVTFLSLVLIGAVSVIGLVITLNCQGSEITVRSTGMSRVWLVAALGGLLGGSARGLYSFLFENWAFHYRKTTDKTSPCLEVAWGKGMVEDDMDPLECWYLFLIKPAAGATLGLLFAAGVELGLISLVSSQGGDQSGTDTKAMLRVLVSAGLAGLFLENAMHALRRRTVNAEDVSGTN